MAGFKTNTAGLFSAPSMRTAYEPSSVDAGAAVMADEKVQVQNVTVNVPVAHGANPPGRLPAHGPGYRTR